MKILMRLLMLSCFFVVAFVPVGAGYEWVVWLLIALMLAAVAGYYWLIYGVSAAQAEAAWPDEQHSFSRFAGMVSGEGTAKRFDRGRLVITDNHVLFIRRDHQKKFYVDWKAEVSRIEEFTIARLLSFRSGVVFTLNDGETARFTLLRASERKDELERALGWTD